MKMTNELTLEPKCYTLEGIKCYTLGSVRI